MVSCLDNHTGGEQIMQRADQVFLQRKLPALQVYKIKPRLHWPVQMSVQRQALGRFNCVSKDISNV